MNFNEIVVFKTENMHNPRKPRTLRHGSPLRPVQSTPGLEESVAPRALALDGLTFILGQLRQLTTFYHACI